MNWGSWDNFLWMGGYGLFVWGSYGMALAILAVEVWQLKMGRRRAWSMNCDALRAGVRDETAFEKTGTDSRRLVGALLGAVACFL